jgi:hypothetical protein
MWVGLGHDGSGQVRSGLVSVVGPLLGRIGKEKRNSAGSVA